MTSSSHCQGYWSSYSTCENDTQFKIFTVTNPGDQNGRPCEANDGAVERRVCGLSENIKNNNVDSDIGTNAVESDNQIESGTSVLKRPEDFALPKTPFDLLRNSAVAPDPAILKFSQAEKVEEEGVNFGRKRAHVLSSDVDLKMVLPKDIDVSTKNKLTNGSRIFKKVFCDALSSSLGFDIDEGQKSCTVLKVMQIEEIEFSSVDGKSSRTLISIDTAKLKKYISPQLNHRYRRLSDSGDGNAENVSVTKTLTLRISFDVEIPSLTSTQNIAALANQIASPDLKDVLKAQINEKMSTDQKYPNSSDFENVSVAVLSDAKVPTLAPVLVYEFEQVTNKGLSAKYGKIGEDLKMVTCELGGKVKFDLKERTDLYELPNEEAYVSCNFDGIVRDNSNGDKGNGNNIKNNSTKQQSKAQILSAAGDESFSFNCDNIGTHFFAAKSSKSKTDSNLCDSHGMKLVLHVTDKKQTIVHRSTFNEITGKNNYSYASVMERFFVDAEFSNGFKTDDLANTAIEALKCVQTHGKDACSDWLPENINSDKLCDALVHSDLGYSYAKKPVNPDFAQSLANLDKALEIIPNFCPATAHKTTVFIAQGSKESADKIFAESCSVCGNLSLEMDSIKRAYVEKGWTLPCNTACSNKAEVDLESCGGSLMPFAGTSSSGVSSSGTITNSGSSAILDATMQLTYTDLTLDSGVAAFVIFFSVAGMVFGAFKVFRMVRKISERYYCSTNNDQLSNSSECRKGLRLAHLDESVPEWRLEDMVSTNSICKADLENNLNDSSSSTNVSPHTKLQQVNPGSGKGKGHSTSNGLAGLFIGKAGDNSTHSQKRVTTTKSRRLISSSAKRKTFLNSRHNGVNSCDILSSSDNSPGSVNRSRSNSSSDSLGKSSDNSDSSWDKSSGKSTKMHFVGRNTYQKNQFSIHDQEMSTNSGGTSSSMKTKTQTTNPSPANANNITDVETSAIFGAQLRYSDFDVSMALNQHSYGNTSAQAKQLAQNPKNVVVPSLSPEEQAKSMETKLVGTMKW